MDKYYNGAINELKRVILGVKCLVLFAIGNCFFCVSGAPLFHWISILWFVDGTSLCHYSAFAGMTNEITGDGLKSVPLLPGSDLYDS